MADYLAVARRALATLPEPPSTKEPEPSKPSFEGFEGVIPVQIREIGDEQPADVAIEAACRCSKRAFPHIHSREDREHAIREWNRDSRHKVERIQ